MDRLDQYLCYSECQVELRVQDQERERRELFIIIIVYKSFCESSCEKVFFNLFVCFVCAR